MTPQTLFFVRFAGKAPESFPSQDKSLPVFAIDVVDDTCTRFLLADRANKFHWIDMTLLARVPPMGQQPKSQFGSRAVLVKH